MSHPRFLLLAAMVLAVALSRLMPHPPNFTPVAALALFAGACVSDRRAAFLVPLAAMLLSDLTIGLQTGAPALGLHAQMPVTYACLALVVVLGLQLRSHRRTLPIAGAVLGGSVIFFVLSNLGVWLEGALYPRTWSGLVDCYVAAIPFFRNTLMGDAAYAALLFGGLAAAEASWPAIRERGPAFAR